MCFSKYSKHCKSVHSKGTPCLTCDITDDDVISPILPGLPDDVAKYCLALVPRCSFPTMGVVCKRWRSYIQSKEFLTVRKLASLLEEWLYILTSNTDGNGCHWEVFDCSGRKSREVPRMRGPVNAGFGVVVLNGKLLIIGGYASDDGAKSPLADVYQYDPCLNSWSQLASMNVPRYDFACAEVDGMVYAVGGYRADGESLSGAEIYEPNTNSWTHMESLRRPRWGCFGCGFEGKLYIMGGRSSFTIGNSKFVDVYNTTTQTWSEIKNGCVMVTTHATLGNKLFCMEWKNPRKISVFDCKDNTWKTVDVPVAGSSSIRLQLGTLGGKLLLFSQQNDTGFNTLVYDPNADVGTEWNNSVIKPSGLCLCSVTIKA